MRFDATNGGERRRRRSTPHTNLRRTKNSECSMQRGNKSSGEMPSEPIGGRVPDERLEKGKYSPVARFEREMRGE
jgi:hypothetical protein